MRHHRRSTRLGFQQFARYIDLVEQLSDAFGSNRSPGPGSGPKLDVSIRISSAQLDNLGLRPVVRAHWFIFAYAPGRPLGPVEPFGVTRQLL